MSPDAKAILKLRIGQSFQVATETARQNVLRSAKLLGVRIVTRARNGKRGGFTVTRLPE